MTATAKQIEPAFEFRLLRIWVKYFHDTEVFDRTLPGVWSKQDADVWLPHDVGASVRRARLCHVAAIKKSAKVASFLFYGQRARDDASKLSFKELESIATG